MNTVPSEATITPYGYMHVADSESKTKFEVEPDESAAIEEIFNDYTSGSSIKEIVNALRIYHPSQRGRQWNREMVIEILKDELYYSGGYQDFFLPTIISDTAYIAAQQRLDKEEVRALNEESVPELVNSMLCKLLLCESCDVSLRIFTERSTLYKCSKTSNHYFQASTIHQSVFELMKELFEDEIIKTKIKLRTEEYRDRVEEYKKRISLTESEERNLKCQEGNYYSLRNYEMIALTNLVSALQRLSVRISNVHISSERSKEEKEKLEELMKCMDKIKRYSSQVPTLTSEYMFALIELCVKEVRVGTNTCTIQFVIPAKDEHADILIRKGELKSK